DLSPGTGTAGALDGRAEALGCDLSTAHIVLQAAPRPGPSESNWESVAESLELAASRAFPGSLFDRRDAAVRGLIRLNGSDEAAAAERLRECHRKLTRKPPL